MSRNKYFVFSWRTSYSLSAIGNPSKYCHCAKHSSLEATPTLSEFIYNRPCHEQLVVMKPTWHIFIQSCRSIYICIDDCVCTLTQAELLKQHQLEQAGQQVIWGPVSEHYTRPSGVLHSLEAPAILVPIYAHSEWFPSTNLLAFSPNSPEWRLCGRSDLARSCHT